MSNHSVSVGFFTAINSEACFGCIAVGKYTLVVIQMECISHPKVAAKTLCFRSVRPFVRPDRSCYHGTSRTAWAISMKLTGNIHQPQLMTWLDSEGQRSRSRQAVEVAKARHPSMLTSNSVSKKWWCTVFVNISVAVRTFYANVQDSCKAIFSVEYPTLKIKWRSKCQCGHTENSTTIDKVTSQ